VPKLIAPPPARVDLAKELASPECARNRCLDVHAWARGRSIACATSFTCGAHVKSVDPHDTDTAHGSACDSLWSIGLTLWHFVGRGRAAGRAKAHGPPGRYVLGQRSRHDRLIAVLIPSDKEELSALKIYVLISPVRLCHTGWGRGKGTSAMRPARRRNANFSAAMTPSSAYWRVARSFAASAQYSTTLK
jgi:hypothetical protein